MISSEYYPIVSLDRIYLKIDGTNIIFLDCTRLNNSKELVSRQEPNKDNSLDNQIKSISNYLLSINRTNIVLADDVVFTGSVLKTIIEKFKQYGIDVIGIRSCISSYEGYNYFNNLPLGIKCGYLLGNDVIDQICERDFYFGIVGSGISVKTPISILKAPYFKPFGNPVERASIPLEYEKYFSESCLTRSLILWEEIERLSKREILIGELPESIQNTDKSKSIVKTLRKELK